MIDGGDRPARPAGPSIAARAGVAMRVAACRLATRHRELVAAHPGDGRPLALPVCRFELGRRDVVARRMDPLTVPPGRPARRGRFDRFDRAPRPPTVNQLALAKSGAAITRLIEAYQEQLVSLEELRAPGCPSCEPARPACAPS